MEETFVQTLTIAGSDSGGGAGGPAEWKTVEVRGALRESAPGDARPAGSGVEMPLLAMRTTSPS